MGFGRCLADIDLRRTLQSLACGKQKVLKKKPVGPDVNDSDTFYFNDDYTNPRYQVKIDSIQVKETVGTAAMDLKVPLNRLKIDVWITSPRKTSVQKPISKQTGSKNSMPPSSGS